MPKTMIALGGGLAWSKACVCSDMLPMLSRNPSAF